MGAIQKRKEFDHLVGRDSQQLSSQFGIEGRWRLRSHDCQELLCFLEGVVFDVFHSGDIAVNDCGVLFALGYADKGKVRESFLAAMFAKDHELGYPKEGDLLVDNRYLFEVGGARKSFQQIKDIPDSFVAADDIEFGIGNKIPLWLFGFLY